MLQHLEQQKQRWAQGDVSADKLVCGALAGDVRERECHQRQQASSLLDVAALLACTVRAGC